MSEAAEDLLVLLAVVAEDRVTAALYRTPDGFLLETTMWPAMWGTHGRFQRALSTEEARDWIAAHGLTEVDL
ncbi:hypothetical protein C4901_15310 [Acidiferrobacter sp. SPIII_3]|uniref:hypothetical protein n=1 Tax=Acidiferrobacter sp. SPIII_3 TaxID=1281578 RepID=UPI000D72E5CD|nr:hypothetical protein [Acidiferrobacter sp. SPIII_3]AWP24524.1 hypothetical protein C4901_15310 [Acidiferrobacter sp. SPIII_3]